MSHDVEATSLRDLLCGSVNESHLGERVSVCGWVAKRREHGEHLAFIDLRDHSGIVQCVIQGTVDVRSEYVLAVEGTVRPRPEGTVNPDLPTGEVELGECTVTVLNRAEPPPFAVDDRVEVDEVIRLKHRFVDLRRPRMQSNLRLRAVVNGALRTAMDRQGFVEVETPLLWAPTPEGAREFVVPSRLTPGSSYVLQLLPPEAQEGGLEALLAQLSDPAGREALLLPVSPGDGQTQPGGTGGGGELRGLPEQHHQEARIHPARQGG